MVELVERDRLGVSRRRGIAWRGERTLHRPLDLQPSSVFRELVLKGFHRRLTQDPILVCDRRILRLRADRRAPPLRQVDTQRFEDERVDVAAQKRLVVERDRRRLDVTGDQLGWMFEEVAVMWCLARVSDRECDLATPPGAADSLRVVGGARWQVAKDDRVQIVEAHSDLERRRAGEDVHHHVV